MQDGTVGRHHKIGAAALNILQQGQAAPTTARQRAQHADIAGAVTDERKVVGGQVGHHNLARHTHRLHLPAVAHYFHHDIVGRDVHTTGRAFVGNEARVAPAIAIGHFAAEHLADGRTLVIVEALGRHECDPDSEVAHIDAALLGMPRDMAQRRRVTKQHSGLDGANGRDELVELGLGHLERRQQPCAQHLVAPVFDAVLFAKLDG